MHNIIDAHVHFWDIKNNINSWIKNFSSLPNLFLPEDLMRKYQSRPQGFIHIEAHDTHISSLMEQRWLSTILGKDKDLLYKTVAFADITQEPNTFEKKIINLKNYQYCMGIRHILSYHAVNKYSPNTIDLSLHKNITNNLVLLSKYNMILHIQCYPKQLANLLPKIHKSQVKCVMDHAGLPESLNETGLITWNNIMTEASLNKNIYIKLSSLHYQYNQEYLYSIVLPCVDIFRSDRCMYGSNTPVAFIESPEIWKNQILSLNLTSEQNENIFYLTAKKLYKL